MPASVASLTVGSSAVLASAKMTMTSTFCAIRLRRSEIALVGVAARRGVDDLLDLRIGQRLHDEFHLGDLAPDVLAEAVGIGDGERRRGRSRRRSPSSISARARAAPASDRRGGALEGLGDHRIDVLGGAERLHHQLVRRRAPAPTRTESSASTVAASSSGNAAAMSAIVHCIFPPCCVCCSRPFVQFGYANGCACTISSSATDSASCPSRRSRGRDR